MTLDNANAEVWSLLADVYSRLDDAEAAASAYAHAVAGDGGNAMLRRNFANTLIALNRLDGAAEQLNIATELDPAAPYLTLRYAELAKARNDRAEAAKWAAEALRRQPEWAEAQEILMWASQRVEHGSAEPADWGRAASPA